MDGQDTKGQETPQVDTEGKTEDGKTETLTKAEHEAQMAKMQSTFEKKARQSEQEAREAQKERDSVRSEISTLTEQLGSLSAELQRRELEGLKDLPEGQRVANLLESARRKEADLLRKEQDLKKREVTALEGLKFKDALALSKEYSIDVDDLMECNTMKEMYEKVAQHLKVTKEEKPLPKVPAHIDSGVSNAPGKGRIWKASEIDRMSTDDRSNHRAEIAKANKEGRIDWNK